MKFAYPVAACIVLTVAAGTSAGVRLLAADRDRDSLFMLHDANDNGVIDEPGEVTLWFSAANAAGTLGPMNPTALAIDPTNGMVVMGDQLNRNVYLLRDANRDGDAQDLFDSKVAADVMNLSGASFAFPTGAAFNANGAPFVMNAGNASGNDTLFRLLPGADDCDAQDAGEIALHIAAGFFGPGNGPYSPQEVFFTGATSGFFRNSSSGLHGIYRFADMTADGDADDAGETIAWWTSAASGVTPAAGFPIEPDLARPGSIYSHQVVNVAGTPTDFFYRHTDLTSDGDANDAGEALLVYSTPEAGFTPIDLLCLSNGDVLVSDNSGIKIYRLRDLDADGLFTSAGERTEFFSNTTVALLQLRQINPLPEPCPGDATRDRMVGLADIAVIINNWETLSCLGTFGDLNADGSVGLGDIAEIITNWGTDCP